MTFVQLHAVFRRWFTLVSNPSALIGGMHAMLKQSSLSSLRGLAAELRVARMPRSGLLRRELQPVRRHMDY